jgi:hypothetical protein
MLAFGKPLTFQLIRQMVAAGDPVEYARWGTLYEDPEFRRTQQLIAAVWGVVYILEAGARVALAFVATVASTAPSL